MSRKVVLPGSKVHQSQHRSRRVIVMGVKRGVSSVAEFFVLSLFAFLLLRFLRDDFPGVHKDLHFLSRLPSVINVAVPSSGCVFSPQADLRPTKVGKPSTMHSSKVASSTELHGCCILEDHMNLCHLKEPLRPMTMELYCRCPLFLCNFPLKEPMWTFIKIPLMYIHTNKPLLTWSILAQCSTHRWRCMTV